MAKIDFRRLIEVAPFEEKTKAEILTKEAELTDEQRFELTTLAWRLLANEYKNALKFMTDSALLDMAQGKKHYSPSDFSEIQVKLYMDFVKRLELTDTRESIETVRDELQKQLRKPS